MCPPAKVNSVMALQRRVAADLVVVGQTPVRHATSASILDPSERIGEFDDAQAASSRMVGSYIRNMPRCRIEKKIFTAPASTRCAV